LLTHQQVIANAKQSKEVKDKATPIQCKAQMESAQFLLDKCSLHGDPLSVINRFGRIESLSKAFVEDASEELKDGGLGQVSVFNTVAQIGPELKGKCGLGDHAKFKDDTCSREQMPTKYNSICGCSMISWMLPGAEESSSTPLEFYSSSFINALDVKNPWVRGVSFATVSGVLCALLCAVLSNLAFNFFLLKMKKKNNNHTRTHT